jgi:hypothetical protein
VPIACGADSVASALHLRLGATPRGRDQTIMTLRADRLKAELLTLHKTGTSHFALTNPWQSLTIDPASCNLAGINCPVGSRLLADLP